MIKISWGTAIAIALGAFIAIMIGFLVWGMRAGSQVAAEDHIYEKSLVYQDELDKKNNAAGLPVAARVRVTDAGQFLLVELPHRPVKAHLYLVRPSDPRQDRDFLVQPDTTYRQRIPRGELRSGRWSVKLYWQHAGKDYLHNQVLILP
ncbi:MAG: FixH family protein [Bacteroidetes bacterium]|nr:FixH family protein [Bacteroidota bacterium]